MEEILGRDLVPHAKGDPDPALHMAWDCWLGLCGNGP